MEITTQKEAKEIIRNWLAESGHSIKELENENSTFVFDIDFPIGQNLNQQIVQPSNIPNLILVFKTVILSSEHILGFKRLKSKVREKLLKEIRNELLFKENSFKFEVESDEIPSKITFTYTLFFDGLTKTNLYRALETNYKTFQYISWTLSDKFGVGSSSPDEFIMYG